MSEPIIRLTGVSRIFTTDEVETHALAEVDLDVHAGEYVAIAGPSGCGKSTLLSILGLLDTPNSGVYLLNQKSVAGLGAAERARIRNREVGFVFQAFNLIGDLTVAENVELPLVYRGARSADRKRRTAEALERVGMSHRAGHYPSQLSGGQQQRVAIARALANGPRMLLADEPTGNLDTRTGREILDTFARLNRERGLTVVMITHDRQVAQYATRRVEIEDGRIRNESAG